MPEYSREYLRELSRSYGYDDILSIAKGQFEDEERMAAKATGLLFCDTDFIVNKIWSIDKFGKCHPWILDMIDQQHYDLYLLCNTDLPWEPDPLRENPEDRERLFELYKTELEERKLPYAIISGTGKERLENAIRVVDVYYKP